MSKHYPSDMYLLPSIHVAQATLVALGTAVQKSKTVALFYDVFVLPLLALFYVQIELRLFY
jgi:hypothetical protein